MITGGQLAENHLRMITGGQMAENDLRMITGGQTAENHLRMITGEGGRQTGTGGSTVSKACAASRASAGRDLNHADGRHPWRGPRQGRC
jgi:hypothetical protein